jgi:hypothetical protein
MGGFGSGNSGFSPSQNIIPGSTKWGTTLADTHQVTGSVDITGSLEVNGSAITGLAGGADTQVQYNDAGSFTGSANLTFDGSAVSVTGSVALSGSGDNIVITSNSEAGAEIGSAHLGDWPVVSNYAFFGHNSLNQSAAGNYGFMQSAAGETFFNAASGQQLNFRINNSNKLNILSDGKVGIGTASPANPLSVTPTLYDTGTASQAALVVTGVGTTWTAAMIGSEFVYSDGTSSGVITAFTDATHLTVTTSQTVGSQAYTIKARGLQVASDGKVGIGTASPAHALHIANAGPTALFLEADTDDANEDDTSYIKMTQDGGSTNSILGLCPNDASKDPAGVTYTGAVGGSFLWGTHTSTPIQIGTSANVRMTIKQAGNVGIGITNPTELLDVAGTANVTTLSIGGTSVTSTAAELNLLDASAVAAPSEGLWTGIERVAVINIGASQHTIGSHVLAVTLPDQAIITKGVLDVSTAFTSDGAALLGLATTGNTYPLPGNPATAIDFLAAFGGSPTVSFALVSAETAIAPLSITGGKLNGASTVTFQVVDADLTAGVANLYVYYIMGS